MIFDSVVYYPYIRKHEEQDIDIQKLVDEWLRVNIKLLQSVQRFH